MKPQHQPVKPGDVCWDPAYAERMLSPVAQVGHEARDWFLTTHSPIVCSDRVGLVTERELFEHVYSSTRPETLVVVKGPQGTGKSQLINWLKVRFDEAVEAGGRSSLGSFRLRNVLIRRQSGSLKDALQQLVAQLQEYGKYLDKIRLAIDDVSGEAAKRRLYTELHNALFSAREGAPKRLRKLNEVFNDNGTAMWLCRPDGAIDRNVRRLREASDVEDRDSMPLFTEADFDFPRTARVNFDEDLQLRLTDDEGVRRQCAEYTNGALRQAIAGLTGLRGHTLNEIFRSIRTEMRQRGEALALFVEDVSTLSVLDEELVNALQPQNDSSLCQLVAVLGMTEPAYDRLPDNLSERISRVVSLAQDSSFRAQDDATEQATDAFVARYLNAIRAGEGQLQPLAQDVRRHGDQRISACDNCSMREACFNAFGAVEFGSSKIGLYPLAPGTATRLLEGQSSETQLRTPRTLLQDVLLALLKRLSVGFQGPSVGLAIRAHSPRDLAAEQDRMLGKWDDEERHRLSYLLYYWTGAETLHEGAHTLQTMLPWFRSPTFANGSSLSPAPRGTPSAAPREKPAPARPQKSDKYETLIRQLDEWIQQGSDLKGDEDFRKALLGVVSNSVQLEEVRAPSSQVQHRVLPLKTSNVEIEGMVRRAAVASRARFEFSRTQEVFTLMRDLAGFTHLGKGTWDFAGGEDARRRYGAWLSKNTDRLVQGFAILRCDRDAALRYGIRFLRLAYRFAERKDLPSETATAVELACSFKAGSVLALRSQGRRLADDLPQRLQAVRAEILDELAVRQGDRGGLNYVDSRQLIEHLTAPADDLTLGQIDADLTSSDFPEIGKLAKHELWPNLQQVLEEELAGLEERIYSLNPILRHWQIATEPLSAGVEEFLQSARDVIKACDAANESIGDESLQTQIRDLAPSVVSRHVGAIDAAVQVAARGAIAILSLDLADVDRTVDFVTRADKLLRNAEERLSQQLAQVVTEDDVEEARNGALASLGQLAALDESAEPGETM